MPPLHKLTAVPAGWPLETVLDAFVHLTKYNPAVAAAQRAQEAVAARLVELWAANPAEAAARLFLHLNEDRSQERLAELLLQHARSEWSRCCVQSFSEGGLEREAGCWTLWTLWPWWEAVFRPRCSELAGLLAAAEAEAEETARKRQKVEAKGQEEQLREEKRQLGERLEAAEAELHSAKEELSQQKLQNAQLNASLEVAQAAAAEKQAELQAAKRECELLTERVAVAEAAAAHKARELQAAQDEGAAQKDRCEQLARRLDASEAEASGKHCDLQRLQDECSKHRERCEQLATRLAAVEAVSRNKPDNKTLVENAVYKDRCEQLNKQLTNAEAKLGQMLVEKGECQERRRQLERQLAEANREVKRFGRHGAHAALACHGESEGASSSPESGLTEQMGYTMVDVDDDASSVLSCSSWFSVKNHCFMSDAIFKTRSCGNDFFLPGGDLKKGSQVVAGDDATILKVAANPELCRATEVVDLQAGAATLRVTPDHLVQVPVPDATGKSGKIAENRDYGYLPAGDLKVGDHVMLDSGEPVVLASVDRRPADCEVLKIVFEPDLPVAVFSSPPCILSKGHKRKPSTRRGKDKNRGRSQGSQGAADEPDETMDGGASIPITAGDYMD